MSVFELVDWSSWAPFPDPRNMDYLNAPFGCGVYQLRIRGTSNYILFGHSNHVAYRMSSLLPKPWGQGTRTNALKRRFVWEHLDQLDYRTMPCHSEEEAKSIERQLKALKIHKFNEDKRPRKK